MLFPEIALTKNPLLYKWLCEWDQVNVQNVPSLSSALNSQNKIPLCTRVSSPWIRFIVEPRASPGIFLPLVSKSDQAGQPWDTAQWQRKEASLRQGETPRQRVGRTVLLSSTLSSAHCFKSLPFCPSSELTHTLEGLPPSWSSRRSPVFGYWLAALCNS